MEKAPLSEAEKTMWWQLRMKRMGTKFRREHPIGPYRADFACLELGIVIELDGGQHTTNEAQHYDARRDAYMKRLGWRVVRIWNLDWFQNPDGVLRVIDETIFQAQHERAFNYAGACSKTPMNRLRTLSQN
jgi:very-short-patch-repair endonuclease